MTELTITPPDEGVLRELFARLEFKTWLAELGGTNDPDTSDPTAPTDYDLVLDQPSLAAVDQAAGAGTVICF